MDEHSYQREFNPKRRLYAPQGYQAHHSKTTKKAISKLEISADFDRLKRKVKKHIIQEVIAEYVCEYDFSGDVAAPRKELLGIEQQVPAKGIIKLKEMAQLVDMVNNNRIVRFSNYKRSPIYIKDEELQFVDKLLDDGIINRLLYYEGYSPAMRGIFPSNLFRAELLKAIKYTEISYRKFCTEEYFGLDRKQNRVFTGLSLSKKEMIDHTQLCKFRSSLSFVQQVNLLVYIHSSFLPIRASW